MDYCEGFKDWLRCFRCERLCTVGCPLERASLEELAMRRRLFEEGRNYVAGGPSGSGIKEG